MQILIMTPISHYETPFSYHSALHSNKSLSPTGKVFAKFQKSRRPEVRWEQRVRRMRTVLLVLGKRLHRKDIYEEVHNMGRNGQAKQQGGVQFLRRMNAVLKQKRATPASLDFSKCAGAGPYRLASSDKELKALDAEVEGMPHTPTELLG